MSFKYLVVVGVKDQAPNPLPVIRKRMRIVESSKKLTKTEVLEEAEIRGYIPQFSRWTEVYSMELVEDMQGFGRSFTDSRNARRTRRGQQNERR